MGFYILKIAAAKSIRFWDMLGNVIELFSMFFRGILIYGKDDLKRELSEEFCHLTREVKLALCRIRHGWSWRMNRKIKIIAVGKVKHDWILTGIKEYTKRLPGLTIVEIKDSHKAKEWAEIKAMLKPREKLVAMTERGKLYDSVAFAALLQRETMDETLVFAIGGPEGISREMEAAANWTLSLSPMTFTHDMARLLLIEQLYRSQNILQNGSYHK
jgi:23S rRNA (pseudouridine1915-N3)-methyltransferase